MQIYKNIDKCLLKILLIFLVFVSSESFSQSGLINIKSKEELILSDFTKIISSKSDSLKEIYNSEILSYFTQILEDDLAFDYKFDTLKNYVSILFSDDNLLKVYTWGVSLSNGEYKYYGFLQHRNKKKVKSTIYSLSDKSKEIENPEMELLTNENWYGALYYELITTKSGKKKYYTLLGWDGNNDFSTKKIIEVLTFNGSEKPKFGSSFEIEKKKSKRVIFEYNTQAKMTLSFNSEANTIVFDHLSPSDPKFEGMYQYYGPDFSYDGLKFDDGFWIYLPDLDIRNKKE